MAVAYSKSAFASPTDLLASAQTYTERPDRVEIVETHVSWVFLTGRYAYKLKKPVHFDGIDFSSIALRRQACVSELWLNRRLAPDVYQSVMPVTRDAVGNLSLNGPGVPVDWVVKMRRLPEERNLRWLIGYDQLQPQDIRSVATTLASFLLNRPPETVLLDTFCRRLARNIQATQTLLENSVPPALCEMVRQVHAVQLQFLTTATGILHERVGDGRIIEGHGDLRPEHIYIEHCPKVIDCIEFSRSLRQVDAIDDLCFLLMECERLGRADVGDAMLSEYAHLAADEVPRRLCSFYKCYRACLRAKISSIRIAQLGQSPEPAVVAAEIAEREQYLRLAQKYAESAAS